MSSPLAVGAVSAVLRNLLDNGIVDVGAHVGSVKVTAIAPDLIKLDDPEAPPSLNLFLYRVTPNLGWRNAGLPSYTSNGSRQSNSPLAIDLHYLLTAYGSADFQAEILLGYAMYLLHEHPVLDRAAIRRALDPSPLGSSILPPAFQALTASDLADQAEAITVTPEPIDTEELARLWSAMQAHYRPTVGYLVTVVLLQARRQARDALPVLTRNANVEPSMLVPLPTIERVEPKNEQPAARLGETVRLAGHHLDGSSTEVHFAHRLLTEPNVVAIGTSSDASGIDVALPSGASAEQHWPAGVYVVSVVLTRPGELHPRESNVAAMLLAPEPQLPPSQVVRDAGTGNVTVTISVRPQVRPAQDARLALGADVASVNPHTTPTSSLDFDFGNIPAGQPWVRLTVDGVESLLVDRSVVPPAFDPSQTVNVP